MEEVNKRLNYIKMYIDFYFGEYGNDKKMDIQELVAYIDEQLQEIKKGGGTIEN